MEEEEPAEESIESEGVRRSREEDEVLNTDIPERLQTRLRGRLECTKEEFDDEVEWIWSALLNDKGVRDEAQLREKVKVVLDLYRNQHYDAPFVAAYRKNLFEPTLNK